MYKKRMKYLATRDWRMSNFSKKSDEISHECFEEDKEASPRYTRTKKKPWVKRIILAKGTEKAARNLKTLLLHCVYNEINDPKLIAEKFNQHALWPFYSDWDGYAINCLIESIRPKYTNRA